MVTNSITKFFGNNWLVTKFVTCGIGNKFCNQLPVNQIWFVTKSITCVTKFGYQLSQ